MKKNSVQTVELKPAAKHWRTKHFERLIDCNVILSIEWKMFCGLYTQNVFAIKSKTDGKENGKGAKEINTKRKICISNENAFGFVVCCHHLYLTLPCFCSNIEMSSCS